MTVTTDPAATPPEDPRGVLAALGDADDGAIALADAALALAGLMHPGKTLQPYREHLTALGDSMRQAAEAAPDDAASAAGRGHLLRRVMVDHWRYEGDAETYEDPQNADLMRVIDRRRGLPVALGILYIHAARAAGWSAEGLNFPGHFLVRLQTEDGDRVIVDPFHGGAEVSVADLRALLKAIEGPAAELTPETWSTVSNRDVLVRLQNNVKLRALEGGRYDLALEAVERLLLISPRDHRLWREAGLMHMRLGDLEGAVAALDEYLDLAPPGQDRDKIAQVMNELRQRLN